MTHLLLPRARRRTGALAVFAPALVLAALVLVAGCAGAPAAPAQHYLLGAAEVPDIPDKETDRRLRVAPLWLAPFLRGDGIVMQTSELVIHQGRDNLWAEDLATQLTRKLRRGLAARLERVRVLDDGDPASAGGAHRLEVEVEAFHGRYDGMAVVAGQWRLRAGDGELLASRRFSVERPLEADGYGALVESLTRAWQSVVAGIAPAVAASW